MKNAVLNATKASTKSQGANIIFEPVEPGYEKIIYWNKKAEAIWGYEEEEVIGKPATLLFDKKQHNIFPDFNGKEIIQQETKCRTKTGDPINVLMRFLPIDNGDGKVIGASAVKRKNKKNVRRKKKEQDLKQIADILSHDLKAPLRGINVLTEWIEEKAAGKLDNEGITYLQLMKIRIRRLHHLVEGIEKYAEVETFRSNYEKLDLNFIIRDAINFAPGNVQFSLTVDEPLPEIVYDASLLTQVLQKLINNSLQFNYKPVTEIRISCKEYKKYWKFSFSDNGPGIPEEIKHKVFDLFFTTNPPENTGMGLSIVKKIIGQPGGKIWVDSKKNKGTTFYFTIPKQ